jgi:hypothetical protein
MSQIPKISVIIPTRDTLQYLPKAIDSVGSDPDLEIVIIDDGSTDGTAAWLAAAAAGDPRLVVLTGPGGSSSRARNFGIAAARAPLIAFLDSDDWWTPGKLESQCLLHRTHPQIGFSFTDYRHVTPAGEDRGGSFAYWPRFHARHGRRTAPFLLGGDALAQLYAENVVGTSTVIARTDLLRRLGGFDETMPSAEDWELWLRLAAQAPVGCHSGQLATYLMHRPGNKTCRMDRRITAMRLIAVRYYAQACAQDRSATSILKARILVASAELADVQGRSFRSAALQAGAFVCHPTRRAARDLLAALLRPVRAAVHHWRSDVPAGFTAPPRPHRFRPYPCGAVAAAGPFACCQTAESVTPVGRAGAGRLAL